MTTTEMHDLFNLIIDETTTGRVEAPEIDRLLNLATDDIIDDLYGNEVVRKPYAFQSSERLRSELNTLITTVSLIPSSNQIVFPSNRRYTVMTEIKVTISSPWINSDPVTYDWLGVNQDNPHIKPSNKKPRHVENSTGILVYPEAGTTIAQARLTYIKNPIVVSLSPLVNSNMPGVLHDKIVRRAAALYERIMDAKSQADAISQEEIDS